MSSEDGLATKKRKRRLTRTDAEYISHVNGLLRKEKELGHRDNCNDITERTGYLLGVSMSSVTKVVREGVTSFPADNTSESRARAGIVTQEEVIALKGKYAAFIAERKRKPTYRELYAIAQASGEWPYSMKTMFYTMRDLGFKQKPKKTYGEATQESPTIVLQRQRYLAMIAEAREEGRAIYYQDESWINAHMQRHKEMAVEAWDDDIDMSGIVKPKSGKGGRSILCGIGSAGDPNGFLKDSFLLYRGRNSNKSDDYHTDMNADVFLDWMESKVMPNIPKLPAKCAIVIDRASYHLTKTEATQMPRSSDTKGQLVDWLEGKGIMIPDPAYEPPEGGVRRAPSVPYRIARKKGRECRGCTKAYLWSLVKANGIPPRYKVAKLVENYPNTDCKLIILPVHHPELNPVELMWCQIKKHVRAENVDLNQTKAEALVLKKVGLLKQESWQNCQRHVLKVEKNYNDITELEDNDELPLDYEYEDEE